MPAVPHLLTRKLTRKIIVIPVTTLLLAAAAFAGYGIYTRSQPIHYARGGSDFAALATQAPSPGVTAGATGTPGADPTATVGATPSPSGLSSPPQAGPTPGSTAGPPVAPAGTSAAAQHLAVPRVGAYQLAVQGSEKVQFGAVGFCSQTLPRRTQLVVSKAGSESALSYDFDVRYFPGSAGKHDERHIYRYTPKGVFLDYEIATVTCQGVRQSSDTSYSPPQLRARLPLSVGASWTNKGGDADRTEKSSSKVTRAETLTVGGEQVPTYVIETTTSISGSESGSRSQTWWYAPAWAMPVKWSEHINGSRSGASYSEDVTVSVLSRS